MTDPLLPLHHLDTQHIFLHCARYALDTGIVWPYSDNANHANHQGKAEGYHFDGPSARGKQTIHNGMQMLCSRVNEVAGQFDLVVGINPSAGAYTHNLADKNHIDYVILDPEDDAKEPNLRPVAARYLFRKNVLLVKEVASDAGLKRVRAVSDAFQRVGARANYCLAVFAGQGLGMTAFVRQTWPDKADDRYKNDRTCTTYMLLHDRIIKEGGKLPIILKPRRS